MAGLDRPPQALREKSLVLPSISETSFYKRKAEHGSTGVPSSTLRAEAGGLRGFKAYRVKPL